MKKYVAAFSIFLCLLLNGSCIPTLANENPSPQSNENPFSQGFYSIRDLNLMENVLYNVQNVSPQHRSFIAIVDRNQYILEFVRLEPRSHQICLRPLKFDYTIVIYGEGQLVFS